MSESNIWKERPHSLLGSKESCNQTDEEKKKKIITKRGKKKKGLRTLPYNGGECAFKDLRSLILGVKVFLTFVFHG